MLIWYSRRTVSSSVTLSENFAIKGAIDRHGAVPNRAQNIADRFTVIMTFPSAMSLTAIILNEVKWLRYSVENRLRSSRVRSKAKGAEHHCEVLEIIASWHTCFLCCHLLICLSQHSSN